MNESPNGRIAPDVHAALVGVSNLEFSNISEQHGQIIASDAPLCEAILRAEPADRCDVYAAWVDKHGVPRPATLQECLDSLAARAIIAELSDRADAYEAAPYWATGVLPPRRALRKLGHALAILDPQTFLSSETFRSKSPKWLPDLREVLVPFVSLRLTELRAEEAERAASENGQEREISEADALTDAIDAFKDGIYEAEGEYNGCESNEEAGDKVLTLFFHAADNGDDGSLEWETCINETASAAEKCGTQAGPYRIADGATAHEHVNGHAPVAQDGIAGDEHNYLRRYGPELAKLGYPILPIPAGTKGPCIPGWPNLPVPRSQELVAAWIALNAPTCGVGIVTGVGAHPLVAIDIDVLDEQHAAAIRAIAEERLGETPFVRIGRAPKAMLIYRALGEVRSQTVHPIEVLSRGRQFVAYHVHPETGRPYAWSDRALLEVQPQQLPGVTQEQVGAALAAMVEYCRQHELMPVDVAQAARAHEATEGAKRVADDRPINPEAIEHIMRHLPNDTRFDSRAAWVTVGHALHHTTDGADWGFALFNEWSQKHPTYDVGETREFWATAKPRGDVGFGTLVKLAGECGVNIPTNIQFRETTIDRAAHIAAIEAQFAVGAQAQQQGVGTAFAKAGVAPTSNIIVPRRPDLRAPTPEEIEHIEKGSVALLQYRQIVPTEWAIPNLVPLQAVTILSGHGGTFKSMLSMQMGVSVALGLPWLGMSAAKERDANVRGAVVGLFTEDPFNETHKRLRNITDSLAMGGRGVQLSDLPHMHLVDFDTENADPMLVDKHLQPTAAYERLWLTMEYMRGEYGSVRLLVLDNAALLFGGNENDRHEVTVFLRNWLGRIARQFGCAIVLLTHKSKNNMTGNHTSGSTAWPNAARSLITTVDDGRIFALEHRKANYGPRLSPVYFEAPCGIPHVTQVASSVATAFEARTAFLDALEKTNASGGYVSDSVRSKGHYAPEVISHQLAGKFTAQQLAHAMGALIADGTIEPVAFKDKAGRPRVRLVMAGEGRETLSETAYRDASQGS